MASPPVPDQRSDAEHRERAAARGRIIDRRWWIALAVVVLGSFSVLGYLGIKINQDKPPIPASVVDNSGRVVMTGDDIMSGQQIWQSLGGQEIGSVWGHGAYVAPDWTADWLHRESMHLLDGWAKQQGAASFDQASPEQQGALKARLKQAMRTNTYDEAANSVSISAARVQAYEANNRYYADMFANGHEQYAIPKGTLTDPAAAKKMGDFFWWTSWAASTDRPGDTVTYTQNWPHEPLIDNVPPAANVVWSLVSIVLLLAGIAALVLYHRVNDAREEHDPAEIPENDPLLGYRPTPSPEGHAQVLLRRRPAVRPADRHGHPHRPLRRRGRVALRHPDR